MSEPTGRGLCGMACSAASLWRQPDVLRAGCGKGLEKRPRLVLEKGKGSCSPGAEKIPYPRATSWPLLAPALTPFPLGSS